MSKKQCRDGEYIPLYWESSTPDAYYIRGHVAESVALGVLEEQGEMVDGKLENGAAIGKAIHKYARWSTEGDAPDGCSRVLRDYKEPGRGRFKVTVLYTGIFAKEDSPNE